MANRYVILGGAGAMGRIIARDLSQMAPLEDELVIADTQLEQAQRFGKSLGREATAVSVDIQDVAATAQLLTGQGPSHETVAINATPYEYNLKVMEAALQAQVHYVDLGGMFHMTRKQLEWNDRFATVNRLALIGMGSAPGISNVLTRYGADMLESVREVHIRVAAVDRSEYDARPPLHLSYSLKTILEEFTLPPAVFTRGEFSFIEPMSGTVSLAFPKPVSRQNPMFALHSEVATLPLTLGDRGLQEVSFKVAFDPEVFEKIKFLKELGLLSHTPLKVGGASVRPYDLLQALFYAQPPAQINGPLDQYEVIRVVVKGSAPLEGKGMEKVTLVVDCHVEGIPDWDIGSDIDTGAPASIAAQMIGKGEITAIGVHPPELVMPIEPFFTELQKRNMRVKVTRKTGWDFHT